MRAIENFIEWIIFASRWLLAPVYLGLVAGQMLFAYAFLVELWILGHHVFDGTKPFDGLAILQSVLGLIDMVMVINLVVMVVIGGYATFVSKLDLAAHRDRPEWLDHIDPGTLKTKLSGALIGISGIHLLTTFTKLTGDHASTTISNDQVLLQIAIHLTFIVSTIALAWSDLILERKLALAHSNEVARDGHRPTEKA